jgi:predicted nucleic acid-binding protein
MSVDRISLDANILFYAIDVDAGERHERSQEIVARAANDFDCVLTLQSLAEFFASTTRKGKLTLAEAAEQVEDWRVLFPVVAAEPDNLRQAIRAVELHNLSFWDAMLWSVVKEAGVELLLSEDLQHERELEGVRFRNPFVMEDPYIPLPQAGGGEGG